MQNIDLTARDSSGRLYLTDSERNALKNGASKIMGTAAGAAGLLAGTVQRGMEMAELPSTDAYQQQVGDLNSLTFNASNFNDLVNQFNSINWAKTDYTQDDLLGMSEREAAGKIALNSLQGGIQGAQLGSNFGRRGAIAGGLAGASLDAVSSGFGLLSRKNKASTESAQLNHEGKIANQNAIAAAQNNALNIGKNMYSQVNIGAEGGPLYINDIFTNGVRKIENGGTHEQNPLEGVPMGIAADGIQNLVEEGELIYNDYVFSKRLQVPEASKVLLGLSKKKDYTFADAAEQIQKESEERPNDIISKRSLDEMMARLQETQETVKAKKEAKRLRAAYNKLTPLEKMNLAYAMQQQQEGQMEFADGGTMVGMPWVTIIGKAADEAENYVQLGNALLNRNIIDNQQKKQEQLVRQTAATAAYNNGIIPTMFAKGGHLFAEGAPLTLMQPIINYPGFNNGFDLAVAAENAARLQSMQDWAQRNNIITSSAAGEVPTEFSELSIPTEAEFAQQQKAAATQKATDKRMMPLRASYNNVTKEEQLPELPKGNPWAQTLRNVSVYGALAGAIGSLFDKPNYSNIERAEKAMAAVPRVSAEHVGQRLAYNPVDINYMMTQLSNQGLGARRALVESSAGPQAIIAGNYNAQTAMGQALLNAMAQNEARKAQVMEFNRGTDTTNIGNDLNAALANQRRDMMGANFLLETGQLRDRELANVQNNRSVQWTNAFNQMHNLGTDMLNRDMASAMAQSYGVRYNPAMFGAGNTAFGFGWPGTESKNGGKLNIKKGGKHA